MEEKTKKIIKVKIEEDIRQHETRKKGKWKKNRKQKKIKQNETNKKEISLGNLMRKIEN